MTGRLTSVAAALLFVGAATACSDPTSPTSTGATRAPAVAGALNGAACGGVFGPTTFTRASGTPAIEQRAFSAPAGDWYKLVLLGANAATVRVALNGQSFITAGDNGARIEMPVTLAAQNLVEIRVGGAPGSSVVLSIVDTRSVASLRIVPTVVQGTTYVLAGATRDFGAEVLDAQGRALTTSCVTWRTADPAVATVNADGVVQGVSAGTTQLIASVGGVESTVTLTVLAPAGSTSVRNTPGPCVWAYEHYFGCFSAEVRVTPVVGGQRLVEATMLNRQGGAPWSLPASVIYRILVLDATGAPPPTPSGFSVALDSGVTTVGSTPTTSITPWTATAIQGWQIETRSGISGCDTPWLPSGPGFWRTCGGGGAVTFSFLGGTGTVDANSLFLNVTMFGLYAGEPEIFSCVNGVVPGFNSCRPGMMIP
ncbi:MAG TPA: Ig-like domain-containing protein [Gemmatimonadaceae bacterium]|nr:Ig-like domain-containing protein [Gemmatimonadaceae bacterium]